MSEGTTHDLDPPPASVHVNGGMVEAIAQRIEDTTDAVKDHLKFDAVNVGITPDHTPIESARQGQEGSHICTILDCSQTLVLSSKRSTPIVYKPVIEKISGSQCLKPFKGMQVPQSFSKL